MQNQIYDNYSTFNFLICRENSVVCLLALKKNLSSLHQTPWVRFAFVKWKMKYISAALGMLVHFIFFIHMLFQTKMMKNKQNKPWDILLWNWKYSRITNKTRLGFSFMNSESLAVKKYFAHRQLWFSIQLPSYHHTIIHQANQLFDRKFMHSQIESLIE